MPVGVILALVALALVIGVALWLARRSDRRTGVYSAVDFNEWVHGYPRAARGKVLAPDANGVHQLVPPVRVDADHRRFFAMEMRERLGNDVIFEPNEHGVVQTVTDA